MKLQIPNQGKKTRTRYWNICVILGIIGFILVGASGTDEPPTGCTNTMMDLNGVTPVRMEK